MNLLPWIILHYKALFKMSMISMNFNKIKSYNVKSAMTERKRETEFVL